MGKQSKRKSSSEEASSKPDDQSHIGKYIRQEVELGFVEAENRIDDFLKENDMEGKGDVGLGRVEDLKVKNKKKRKRDEIKEQVNITVEGRKVGEKRKTMDEQFILSKEGFGFEFDDESQLLRTIFVSNLPLNLNKKALLEEFTKFGEVESVSLPPRPLVNVRQIAKMKGDMDESLHSVHAYIVFKDEKSAQACLTHNIAAVVGGSHIHVDQACPPRKKLKGFSSPIYDSQRAVFVGNLPFDIKDKEIYQLVSGVDQLESSIEVVRVIRDPNSSVGTSIAYVLFKTREAANLIIRKRHLMLRDCLLRFYHAKSDATPSKKRNLPTTDVDNSSKKRFVNASAMSQQEESNPSIKTVLSYQELKICESSQLDDQDKDGFNHQTCEKMLQKPSTAIGAEVKQCANKQPAVAVRKTKTLYGVEASRQIAVKRKPDSCTTDSFHRKKARNM